jgi:hypothetical protein
MYYTIKYRHSCSQVIHRDSFCSCRLSLYDFRRYAMRYKRKAYFKKLRHRKILKMFLFGIIMPSALVLLGYLTASLIILPSMEG